MEKKAWPHKPQLSTKCTLENWFLARETKRKKLSWKNHLKRRRFSCVRQTADSLLRTSLLLLVFRFESSLSLANSHFLPSTFLFKMAFSPYTTRWTPPNRRKSVIIKFLHNALMYLAFNYHGKKANTFACVPCGEAFCHENCFLGHLNFPQKWKNNRFVRSVCVRVLWTHGEIN